MHGRRNRLRRTSCQTRRKGWLRGGRSLATHSSTAEFRHSTRSKEWQPESLYLRRAAEFKCSESVSCEYPPGRRGSAFSRCLAPVTSLSPGPPETLRHSGTSHG